MIRKRKRGSRFVLFSLVALATSLAACGGTSPEQFAGSVAARVDAAVEDVGAPDAAITDAGEAMQAAPLTVDKQGFGQNGAEVGYAFIVTNPNADAVIENVGYRVTLKDAAGTILQTDSNTIPAVFPAGRLGVAGTVSVAEGATVASMDVELSRGDPIATGPVGTFTVDAVTYHPNDYYNFVTAAVTNPFDVAFEQVPVAAVAFDDGDNIVGGARGLVSFLPAAARTGVTVPVTAAGEVARVELYPIVSFRWLFADDSTLPDDAQPIRVSASGFGVSEFDVGYGFLVENPNAGYAVESSQYRVTVYGREGEVLATDESYLTVLLPGQTLGVGATAFIWGSDAVDHVEVQLLAGDYVASGPIDPLRFEGAAFVPDDFLPQVTGTVVSPYTQDIVALRVSALAFDAAGAITGAGFTFIDSVPANGSAAVSVPVTVAGTPARVELYGSIYALSAIDE